MERIRNKRNRFTYQDDVYLLREVVAQNPFTNGYSVWETIKQNLTLLTNKEFSPKTLRQHCQMLLDNFNNKNSSGIGEPCSERDELVLEILSLQEEMRREKEIKENRKLEEIENLNLAKRKRDSVAQFLIKPIFSVNDSEVKHEQIELDESRVTNNSEEVEFEIVDENEEEVNEVEEIQNRGNISRPMRRRLKQTTQFRESGLEYLKRKSNREMALEEKKLQLEEKRLQLDERRLAIEERKMNLAEKKLNFDNEQYRLILENQQKIISALLVKIK